MNILFINTVDTKGGAARVAYSLKTEMNKLGHSASMFVKIKYSPDPDVFVIGKPGWLSLFIKKITGKDIGGYLNKQLHRILATDIDFFSSDSILQSEEFKKADIIHCHNLHGNYFKLKTLEKMSMLKPVMWTFHDMWPITPHCAHAYDCLVKDGFFGCPSLKEYQELMWHNESYLKNKKKKIYDKSDFSIVTPSIWIKNKVEQTILKDKELSLIYNGVDTSEFKRYDKKWSRCELNLPINKKIILFISIGKNISAKGWDHALKLISSFKDKPDTVFVCIGSGKRYAGNISFSNVIFADYVASKNIMAKYYSAADVFLFPSPAENFPLTVLEAMSCGLPVVSFDIGGVKEALTHMRNGYVAKYSDSEDLTKGVKSMLSLDKDELETMSRDSMEKVRIFFSEEKMIKNHERLYTETIEKFKANLKKIS